MKQFQPASSYGKQRYGSQQKKAPPCHLKTSTNIPGATTTPTNLIPTSAQNEGSLLDMAISPRKKLNSKGTRGKPILIETNYLALSFKKLGLAVHYDVVIEPDTSKALLRMAMEEFRLKHYPDRYPAFDGLRNLFSSSELPFGNHIKGDITIVKNGISRTFQICIKFTNKIDLSALTKYFNCDGGRDLINAQEAIQCINVVLRSAPALTCLPAGRSFFTIPQDQIINLGGGMEMYYGFYQSAILGWKPFLNMDVMHRAFPKNQPILDLIKELCPTANLNYPLSGENFKTVDKFMSTLKVHYQIPKQPSTKRTMRVNQLDKSANEAHFEYQKKYISVVEYYQTVKHYALKFPSMPCLWVGPKTKESKILIPVELCIIVEGQLVKQSLTPSQTAALIKVTATAVPERKRKIINSMKMANFNENPSAKEFGISVDPQFTKTPARVLDAPILQYKNTTVKPEKGVWRPSQFHKGKSLENWGLISFDRYVQQQAILKFVEGIISQGRPLGMQISKPKVVTPIKLTRGREKMELKQYLERYKNLNLVIIVLPMDNKELYSYVKQTAELRFGTLTQCVRRNTVERSDPSTLKNILLKVNAKLNGINHKLEIRPSCLNRPCMIMGADVTHPIPECKGTTPSMVAVTASLDAQAFHYTASWRLQPPTQEIITDLAAIVKEQLIHFYKQNNSAKPECIIFFRDGVSEGQFQTVLNAEVSAIRDACSLVQPNGMYRPKITFLVVQKRHHTRFFATNMNDVIDRNGNVSVGTCVDTDITHPVNLDFYLLSHATMRGVARPTKYCVLWDDNDMSEDEVEELSFHLCHMYSRCTRSVSYPAPTYYAHLAAARAKVYCNGRNINLENLKEEQMNMCFNDNAMKDLPMFFV